MPEIMLPAAPPVLHRATSELTAEIRDGQATGDGTTTFHGYASVTGVETTLYEGRSWVWREVIAPGAFTRVLSDIKSGAATYSCVLNHEHDNAATMASTAQNPNLPGGMELTEDGTGLRVFARLDPADLDVQRVCPKIKNNTVRQMSFAFTIAPMGFTTVTTEDEMGRVVETDTVTELGALYDVTVCAHGAYPTTTADIRGYLAALGRSGIDPEGLDVRRLIRGAASTETTVAPSRVGGGVTAHERARIAAQLRRAAVGVTHPTRSNRS